MCNFFEFKLYEKKNDEKKQKKKKKHLFGKSYLKNIYFPWTFSIENLTKKMMQMVFFSMFLSGNL